MRPLEALEAYLDRPPEVPAHVWIYLNETPMRAWEMFFWGVPGESESVNLEIEDLDAYIGHLQTIGVAPLIVDELLE